MLATAASKVPLYRRPSPVGQFTTPVGMRRLCVGWTTGYRSTCGGGNSAQRFFHHTVSALGRASEDPLVSWGLAGITSPATLVPMTAPLAGEAQDLASNPTLSSSSSCRSCLSVTSCVATPTIFRHTTPLLAYHYVHPKSSRPIRQYRKYGDPRYINNEVALIKGLYGLITVDFGMVTQSQLESARLAILRRIPRGAFSLVMHTDFEEFPVVKKSPESRMGAGKSNIHHFAYKFTTGVPLFEIFPTGARRLNQAEAEGIFLAGRPFIPLQTAVVPRGRVDEYHVFK